MKKHKINDPYRWMIGVLDKRTNEIIFDAKNMDTKQFELTRRELKKKFW